MTKFTDEMKDECVRLYLAGGIVKKFAPQIGMARSAIYNMLKARGVLQGPLLRRRKVFDRRRKHRFSPKSNKDGFWGTFEDLD